MKTLVRMIAIASAAAVLSADAQDFDDLLADDGASTAEDAEPAEAAEDGEEAPEDPELVEGAPKKESAKTFYLLPFCRELEGQAEVLVPGVAQWRKIEEGKYYPLGSVYRTLSPASRLRVVFGRDCEVSVRGEASFGTRPQAMGEQLRTVTLQSGTITVKVPGNLPEGLFTVAAPGFTAYNPAGESRYTYRLTGDGDEAVVRCVTKALSVKGPHFDAIAMRAANELRIVTSKDMLFTGLYGSRGDILVRLDQGRIQIKDYGTGEVKLEDKFLDWKLSPRTAVRIHRAKPAIGEKLAVTVMTFDERGDLKNRCAFTEKTVEVNSGELGPTSKKDREELAKRAASVAEMEAEAVSDSDAEDAGSDDGEETPADDDAGGNSADVDLGF